MKKNLKIRIIGVLILIIGTMCIGIKFYNSNKNYNKYLSEANSNVSLEKYDNAISLYQEALKYKNDTNISKQIELIKLLKNSKENYESADKKMNDKKYLDAIDMFKKVDKQDTKRYSYSQTKIDECKKLYIAEALNSVNDDLKNNKFDDANNVLNNIFKIDPSNANGLKLKDMLTSAIEKQKKQQDLREKGIRPLGELRKVISDNYIILTDADKPKQGSDPDKFNYSKYENYDVLAIGGGKYEDPDNKLVEPDLIINDKPAYSVWMQQAIVAVGGGNLKSFLIESLDSKIYTLNEVQEAIDNNKAFYKDGKPFQLPKSGGSIVYGK